MTKTELKVIGYLVHYLDNMDYTRDFQKRY